MAEKWTARVEDRSGVAVVLALALCPDDRGGAVLEVVAGIEVGVVVPL